jgi:hypothetical protein
MESLLPYKAPLGAKRRAPSGVLLAIRENSRAADDLRS